MQMGIVSWCHVRGEKKLVVLLMAGGQLVSDVGDRQEPLAVGNSNYITLKKANYQDEI